jgi:predicted ATPase
MKFVHVARSSSRTRGGENVAYLIGDDWDDYTFRTLFKLLIFDRQQRRYEIGDVKILSRGMNGGRVQVPDTFETLPPLYCSLGQTEGYYEQLTSLPDQLGDRILNGLRDCVQNPQIFFSFRAETGFQKSLLRIVPETSIVTTFRRALKNQVPLTSFAFAYTFPDAAGRESPTIRFSIEPGSMPPTNVHVIIGRNGAGKTRLLGNIAKELCRPLASEPDTNSGTVAFEPVGPERLTFGLDERFANLVTVAFSAFDPFDPPVLEGTSKGDIRYAYVGLKTLEPVHHVAGAEQYYVPKDTDGFTRDFETSLASCSSEPRLSRWREAIETLESDPSFAELRIAASFKGQRSISALAQSFSKLSSGHKIVVLIITRLVELVDEKTLVLLDEPESHLHPPLLSSFIRAVSALLTLRNGVAVIATHSPVVLQEVPQSCVWVLRRSGQTVAAERPQIETFGENVGVLTREIFGLDVTASGFHQLIASKIGEHDRDYNAVINSFGNQIGSEGRAIALALSKKQN